MSIATLNSEAIQSPGPLQSNFSDRIKKQNGQERLWMHRRDAISVESGGTAMKEKNALYASNIKADKDFVHSEGNALKNSAATAALEEEKKNDKNTLQENNRQASHIDRRKQRRAKRDASLAAYGRRKQKDPLLGARLSLLGLANARSSGTQTSWDSLEKGDERISAEIDPNEGMAESAAVTSPAFGLMVPYNTMSSILSDVSYEEGSLMSHSISNQSAMAIDETHRRGSDYMNLAYDSEHIHSENSEQGPSLNPPSTPKHESKKPTLLAYIQASPAVTDNSRASSGSTVNTSILFPNRESQRSSLGMLLVADDDVFPKPPIRRGYDTFSDDGTTFARGALEMDEETPKARPVEINEFDYRNKPLPAIRDSSEDDRTIRQSVPASPMKEGTNFLQAHNAIGLLLMPASGDSNISSELSRKK